MRNMGGAPLVWLLVIFSTLTLLGVDVVEGSRTSGRRGGIQVQRGSRTQGSSNNSSNNSNSSNSNSSSNAADRAARRAARRERRRGRGRGRARSARNGRVRSGGKGREPFWKRNGCEEIYLPMCKGQIPYRHTKLPNQFNDTTQAEVFRRLQRLDMYMDNYCSRNLRLMLCAQSLPKCNGRRTPKPACKATCEAARLKCAPTLKDMFGLEWDDEFSCEGLPEKQCVGPMKDKECKNEFPHCSKNSKIHVCRGQPFKYGALPNMFGQCHSYDINKQLRQYQSLRNSKCHPQLDFILCGAHTPYCIHDDAPFTFPCQDVCNEVRAACEADYKRLNHNLPWPRKLQCHIYPTSDTPDQRCVMPNDTVSYTPPRRRRG